MSVLEDQIQSFKTSMGIVIDIADGDENTVVQTPGGPVPSINKLVADAKSRLDSLKLVSGVNIKTVNGKSLLGSGDYKLPIVSFLPPNASPDTYGSNYFTGLDGIDPSVTGRWNMAYGDKSLQALTSGNSNNAYGDSAGQGITTGSNNTLMGDSAGNNISTGSNNTSIGVNAMVGATTSSNNTVVGGNAGSGITTENTVTLLGANSDIDMPDGVGGDVVATAVGYGSKVTTANTVALGRPSDVTVIGATGDDGSGNHLQVTGGASVDKLFVNGKEAVDAENITTLAPSLTGEGASGTWDISINGEASTATKLTVGATINGILFDGSKPITISAADATDLEPTIAAGTISQYWRGDKTWQAMNKAAVGLDSADNTSDLNKPISTAQQAALDTKLDVAKVGVANGVTPLGADSKIAAVYLPSYVDDVLEYANLAAFPATGSSGAIYVADDTGKIYRWSGSTYIEISPSPGSTDAVPEGPTNKYYTDARAAAAAPVQSVAGKTGAVTLAKADVDLANVDNTSDANKPVSTATQNALNLKADITYVDSKVASAGSGGMKWITANGTLTSAGDYVFTGNYSVTLPDLTTLGGKSLSLIMPSNGIVVSNPGPGTVITSDGWTVKTGFSSDTIGMLVPLDITTPHGWWGHKQMVPKVLSTPPLDFSFSPNPTQGGGNIFGNIQLSPNCIVIGLCSGATLNIFCVDPTTGDVGARYSIPNTTITTATLLPNGSGGFVVVYGVTNATNAIAFTVSGLMIAAGAVTPISASYTMQEVACQVGSSYIATFGLNGGSGNSMYFAAFTVSGTAIIVGSPVSITTVYSTMRVYPISSGAAIAAYTQSSAAPFTWVARLLNVSGSTIIIGNAANPITGVGGANGPFCIPFGDGSYLFGSSSTSTGSVWNTVTVSGTTITSGVQAAFSGNNAPSFSVQWNPCNNYTNQRTRPHYTLYSYTIDSSNIVIASGTSAYVISKSGNTLVATIPVSWNNSDNMVFLRDFNTRLKVYATSVIGGTGYFSKMTVTGTTLSFASSTAGGQPDTIFSDTLNDVVVNYGGINYAWYLPTKAHVPLASDKFLSFSAGNSFSVTIHGNFS